jgi:hypothetical protein
MRNLDGHLRAIGGPDALSIFTPVETYGNDLTTRAEFTVRAGERVPFLIMWHPSHLTPPEPLEPFALDDTKAWWEEWSGRCTYDGPWQDEVMRSLITLKA